MLVAVAHVDLGPLPFAEKCECTWPEVAFDNNDRIIGARNFLVVVRVRMSVAHGVSMLADRPGRVATLDLAVLGDLLESWLERIRGLLALLFNFGIFFLFTLSWLLFWMHKTIALKNVLCVMHPV